MANVNINRNLSDQFYRYKMPKLVAKVEGKGNGIKTVIVNMPEIAKSLNRPPMYPTKYFGCLLGAQVNFDNKSERYIVNGAHDSNKLQDLLDGFIQKYVLCQSCENPETILSVNKKKEVIGTNCMACGHSGTISAANDRVAAYILKNPPPKPQAAAAPTAAAAAAAAESAAAGPAANHIGSMTTNNDDDDDWGEDTNEDAVRKRMDQLSAGAKSLMLNDDLEKSQDERLQIFFEFVEKQSKTVDLTVSEHQKAIKAEADRLDISDKAVIVLCEVLFKDNLIEKVKLYKNLFLRFTHENHKAQKYLLRGIELTISSMKEQLMPKVTMIFNTFYDLEIIVEDVFLDWFAKGQKRSNKLDETSRELIEKARPFIKWLNEASEESESDEDDENVDVDFDDRLVGDVIKVTEQENNATPKNTSAGSNKAASNDTKDTKTTASTVKETKPDEDEIDIDAI
jgi:translation initiation factor 5